MHIQRVLNSVGITRIDEVNVQKYIFITEWMWSTVCSYSHLTTSLSASYLARVISTEFFYQCICQLKNCQTAENAVKNDCQYTMKND